MPNFTSFWPIGKPIWRQMGKWPWQCTTTGLDNSTELRMEIICQRVTVIWVPQVWQPPARPSAHPPACPPARTVTTIPLQPGGLRGKNIIETELPTSSIANSCLMQLDPQLSKSSNWKTSRPSDAYMQIKPSLFQRTACLQFECKCWINVYCSFGNQPQWL